MHDAVAWQVPMSSLAHPSFTLVLRCSCCSFGTAGWCLMRIHSRNSYTASSQCASLAPA